MKIPRYKDTDVNISSGRSLTTGIGSSQGLVDIGKTALNAVTQYANAKTNYCLLYTSPSPRDGLLSRMPSSA